jgi:hypothetical protein
MEMTVTRCTDRWLRLVIDGMFSRYMSSNCTASGAAVNRRVVGSNPTSGAKFPQSERGSPQEAASFSCDRYVTGILTPGHSLNSSAFSFAGRVGIGSRHLNRPLSKDRSNP